MSRSPFRLPAILAATALALSACGGGDGAAPDGKTGDGDTITIGIKFDQPGLGQMKGGTPSGFDVDVAKGIAEGLGYAEEDIVWKESPTPQRETLLETGQIDIAVASYSISDERKKRVQFAGPYFVAGQDILVRADDDEITGPESLDGKVLCSLTGSTSAANVKEQVPGVQLQEYGTASECVEQVVNGTIDAFSTDDAILAGYAAQQEYAGQLKIVGNTFSEENYGIGLAKESEDCEQINEIINRLWEDGTMESLVEKHFGPAGYTPDDELNPPTAGGHCG